MLFLEDVEFYKGLCQLRDGARTGTVAQAEKNLGRKPELDALQRELEAKASELEALKQAYNSKRSQQLVGGRENSPQALIALLEVAHIRCCFVVCCISRLFKAATNTLDEETEALSSRFLSGQVGIFSVQLLSVSQYHDRCR